MRRTPIGEILLSVCIAVAVVAGLVLYFSKLFFHFTPKWFSTTPEKQERAERVLAEIGQWANLIAKCALWGAGGLFAVYFLSSLLGWGPPLPTGEPGEYNPRD